MKQIATCSIVYIIVLFILQGCTGKTEFYKASDFAKVPKTDAHFHYLSTDKTYMEFASSLNFKLLSPIWDGEEVSVHDQLQCSKPFIRHSRLNMPFWVHFGLIVLITPVLLKEPSDK